MKSCFLFNGPVIAVRRTAAVGDSLAASCVADKLYERGFRVEYVTHQNNHCLLRRQPSIARLSVSRASVHVDLDQCYEKDPSRKQKHFSQMFIDSANAQLMPLGIRLGEPRNCRPRIILQAHEREMGRQPFLSFPKPWVFVCPRSNSYAVRQVPDGIWQATAEKIQGTKFWLGTHPAPRNFVDLQCRHLDNLIIWLASADLLISVDTGPLHIAAALGIPILAIGQSSSPELHLSDQRDFITIYPAGLRCLNCQLNLCPIQQHQPPCQKIDPGHVANWANARLAYCTTENVSAVISVYRPKVEVLNRCLTHVLPQVSEIVVCRDNAGRIPDGALQNAKIRYIVKPENDVGYGRKANHAARHACGKYLLFLNDDVFLDPEAVQRMKAEMVDGVGIVSCLLRYPDGTIQHAGKTREPNIRGWGHIDHRKYQPTFREPVEAENTCGACILVRREAFFKAGGFDEDFYLYAEDDALCLAMRKEGYRIIYTPHATGTHLEHQSTELTPNIIKVMHASNALFDQKWGAYLTWNATRIPGNFDYLKA